jgi:hypothetical protein
VGASGCRGRSEKSARWTDGRAIGSQAAKRWRDEGAVCSSETLNASAFSAKSLRHYTRRAMRFCFGYGLMSYRFAYFSGTQKKRRKAFGRLAPSMAASKDRAL